MDEQSFSVSFFITTPLTKKDLLAFQKKKKKTKKKSNCQITVGDLWDNIWKD